MMQALETNVSPIRELEDPISSELGFLLGFRRTVMEDWWGVSYDRYQQAEETEISKKIRLISSISRVKNFLLFSSAALKRTFNVPKIISMLPFYTEAEKQDMRDSFDYIKQETKRDVQLNLTAGVTVADLIRSLDDDLRPLVREVLTQLGYPDVESYARLFDFSVFPVDPVTLLNEPERPWVKEERFMATGIYMVLGDLDLDAVFFSDKSLSEYVKKTWDVFAGVQLNALVYQPFMRQPRLNAETSTNEQHEQHEQDAGASSAADAGVEALRGAAAWAAAKGNPESTEGVLTSLEQSESVCAGASGSMLNLPPQAAVSAPSKPEVPKQPEVTRTSKGGAVEVPAVKVTPAAPMRVLVGDQELPVFDYLYVDCDNADPATFIGFLEAVKRNSSPWNPLQVFLYADERSCYFWQMVEILSTSNCKITTHVVPFLHSEKSVVDLVLSTGLAKLHTAEPNKKYGIYSSDSDFFGLLTTLGLDSDISIVCHGSKVARVYSAWLTQNSRNVFDAEKLTLNGTAVGMLERIIVRSMLDRLQRTPMSNWKKEELAVHVQRHLVISGNRETTLLTYDLIEATVEKALATLTLTSAGVNRIEAKARGEQVVLEWGFTGDREGGK